MLFRTSEHYFSKVFPNIFNKNDRSVAFYLQSGQQFHKVYLIVLVGIEVVVVILKSSK